ncbi:uncharacterized protein LOC114268625 [Camellia sinensis]|uniref:uncharacterized protein LOC114268625 n=1 Tax=Camellia sinensis TaxID=4442 RepID=UPI00103629E7|nr:uncharacterized protein LOC114268625 [Camellia sinensis]
MKKAKAIMTQIESKDTVPISKLVETEKSRMTAEKRPAEVDASDSQPSKKPRSEQPKGSQSFSRNMTWAPEVMVDDKPLTAGDNTMNLEVGVALPMAIQHAHSYAVKTEMMRKGLARKTKEVAKLLSSLHHAGANNQALLDQAEASKVTQDLAEEKAKTANDEAETARADLEAAKGKAADLEAKLQEALASKEAEVNAADEKAFEEGQTAVRDQYKQQEPNVSGDEADEDDAEDGGVDEVEEEAATDPKSPTLNEQIDLTQDEEDDLVSKGISPKPTSSEAEVQCTERSLDQTLQKIDAEIVTEKNATPPSQVDKSQISPST